MRVSLELERARQAYEELLAFGTETRRLGTQARALAQLGWIAVFTGDPESAVATLERAVAIQRRRGDSWGMARASIRLAAALSRAGRHQEGLDVFRDVSDLAQEIDAGHLVRLALGGTGRIYYALGEIEHGRQLLTRGRALSRDIGVLDQEMQATYSLARLERDQGDLAAALRLLDSATALAESRRARVAMDALRVTLLARTRALYELQIAVLLELHESDPQV